MTSHNPSEHGVDGVFLLSLWNMTGISIAMLAFNSSRRLPNFKAIPSLYPPKFCGFGTSRSNDITFYQLKQTPEAYHNDVITGEMASQITTLTIVCSTVYSGADQRKHQSSALLVFVRGIHRPPVNSPHKWPVTRKMFPFDDVIMYAIQDIRPKPISN